MEFDGTFTESFVDIPIVHILDFESNQFGDEMYMLTNGGESIFSFYHCITFV